MIISNAPSGKKKTTKDLVCFILSARQLDVMNQTTNNDGNAIVISDQTNFKVMNKQGEYYFLNITITTLLCRFDINVTKKLPLHLISDANWCYGLHTNTLP